MTERELVSPCKICGKMPFIHKSPVMANGCSFTAWIVECDNDDDDQRTPPFVEHSLVVYGSTKEEAIDRWDEIAND
ncbi:hypothetical protein VPFG_00120 [Vibrio phage nt-1]|uniref:Uncharacterized protein n=1 Tax=Vibrio phage nt-1 TaxID=115992 RepID=R9TJ54_9CAUD|nr:hypothetical protein VPFG_00120 [Vibrio phage nt-1]AGN30122.1 hypothetical protein VPFG_00120 [Vibrio phage nt-1]